MSESIDWVCYWIASSFVLSWLYLSSTALGKAVEYLFKTSKPIPFIFDLLPVDPSGKAEKRHELLHWRISCRYDSLERFTAIQNLSRNKHFWARIVLYILLGFIWRKYLHGKKGKLYTNIGKISLIISYLGLKN